MDRKYYRIKCRINEKSQEFTTPYKDDNRKVAELKRQYQKGNIICAANCQHVTVLRTNNHFFINMCSFGDMSRVSLGILIALCSGLRLLNFIIQKTQFRIRVYFFEVTKTKFNI